MTSTKKHDNMPPVSFSPSGANPASRPFYAGGNATTFLVWCPTARSRETSSDQNSVADRTSDVCYIRGLKETINISNYQNSASTNYAAAWKWRRIVFSAKGLYQALGTSVDYAYTSNGYVRFLADQNGTPFGATVSSLIFQGVSGVDWVDTMTAKADNTRLTIHYDRTRTLTPASSAKRFWNFKMWHPVNKNLNYNNEESGDGETASLRSTLGKPGIGDVYVVDILQCASGNSDDLLAFGPEATLYWHEK